MRRLVFLLMSLGACSGTITGPRGTDPRVGVATEAEQPTSAIPRLSRREAEASIVAVFGLPGLALRNLPADPPSAVNPLTLAEEDVFDTLAADKHPDQVFVEGLEGLAFEVGRDFSADTGAVAALAGCAPVSTGVDTACLSSLIDHAALTLWRRPIDVTERDALVTMATTLAADAAPQSHQFAVRAAVMTLVQSPEFVYRSELGTPLRPGLARLNDREFVSRLAAFLWGSAPSRDLLSSVETNPLDDAAVAALVEAMLSDPRATAQMRTFHQLWLRYPDMLVTDAALAADLRLESDTLVDRAVLTPGTPWTSLFSATQTWLTPRLSAHYGLPSAPVGGGWVPVPAPRAGLLSHGSFLSLSSTRGSDTLPSRRGAMLARRVLCQTILPPPKDVNIDNGVAVAPGACKPEAYRAHAGRGSCAGCHFVIDGLGFGFERLDGLGRYREVEPARAQCAIDGVGQVRGVAFSGPQALFAQNQDTITSCGVDQLTRFAFRDRKLIDEHVQRFHEALVASGYDFRALMRTIALDPRFRVRIEEIP